ncbi:MAG: lysophospholipid acyltransferase family protein [Alphaproteobacteria bacterium]|nr:lysophospholipid acyltransferase family protein [Alphaproteobacteria bacterium]
MIFFRSLLYALWFYGSLGVIGGGFLPYAVGSRKRTMITIRQWSRAQVFGLRWLCGVRTEYRGLENLPASGVLVAMKHQSTYDTITPFLFTRDPAFVLKQELLDAPVFGIYARRADMIPIDRDGGMKTMKQMLASARALAEAGREVIIFPEGTRQLVGAVTDLKPGVAGIYRAMNVPCIPVAINTGLCWPAAGFIRKPGLVVFEALPAIEAGLSRDEFMRRLHEVLEPATQRLVAEGRAVQAKMGVTTP